MKNDMLQALKDLEDPDLVIEKMLLKLKKEKKKRQLLHHAEMNRKINHIQKNIPWDRSI
jgi:hypothetical protein